MEKVSDIDVRIVYRRGNRFALLFAILIPAGIAARVVLEADWFPVSMVIFMGLVASLVAATREQLVVDTLTKTILCTESFFGRDYKSELIPFGRVTRITVEPNYERVNQRSSQAVQSGFQLAINWDAKWGGGRQMVGVFYDEVLAKREAEGLARRIGTKVQTEIVPA